MPRISSPATALRLETLDFPSAESASLDRLNLFDRPNLHEQADYGCWSIVTFITWIWLCLCTRERLVRRGALHDLSKSPD
jgi:hypothetical protein